MLTSLEKVKKTDSHTHVNELFLATPRGQPKAKGLNKEQFCLSHWCHKWIDQFIIFDRFWEIVSGTYK